MPIISVQFLVLTLLLITRVAFHIPSPAFATAAAADPPFGSLSVNGNQIVGADGQPVVLHGMSLYWSQMPEGAEFYNAETVMALRNAWNANVVRIAIGIDTPGGYLDNPAAETAKVNAVVDAAIEEGIYVIVDWHTHDAISNENEAVTVFGGFLKKWQNFGSRKWILLF